MRLSEHSTVTLVGGTLVKRMPYLPALDGLRAIAVGFVLLYHGRDAVDLPAVLRPSGGFLGVEMFFVISGFLITSLLVHEQERSGSIDIPAFWLRRARRLLPALYGFLLGAIAMAALFAPDAMAKIRSEILGALLYVSNWLLIFRDESYFESSARPSFLRHLWSLAIEEQFYILWPLFVLAGLRLFSRKQMAWLTLVGVIMSTVVMWILFERVEPFGDVTSVYFRTDSRAAGLLVGSAAAFVWRPWSSVLEKPDEFSAPRVLWIDIAGAVALAFMIGTQYWFTDDLVEWGKYEVLFRGGFLLTSVPTLVVISAVAIPRSQLGAILGWRPFVWIGARSYGIYLWHWPVFQMTRPGLDVENAGWETFVVRLAITVALAELSYTLLEQSVREGRFTAKLGRHVSDPRKAMGWGGIALVGLALAALFLPITNRQSPDQLAGFVQLTEAHLDGRDQGLARNAVEPASTGDARTAPVNSVADPISESIGPPSAMALASVQGPTNLPTPGARSGNVVVVGDSVAIGASSELSKIGDQVVVDAEVGRQWWHAPQYIDQLDTDHSDADYVVVHLGNNGSLNTQMFDDLMRSIGEGPRVIFATVSVPRSWESTVNAAIREGVNRWSQQALLADWNRVAEGHPEFFASDGVHLNRPGQRALRDLLISVMGA